MKKNTNVDAKEFMEKLSGERFNFSMLIRGYRSRHELTQIQLAKKLEVSKSYLCDIEKKRKYVSVEQAKKFAKKLKEHEEFWVSRALQDMVDRAGIKATVKLVA
jgi:putative transcriptional regulator